MFFISLLLITIYFIILDELIMGCVQRRIGVFNIGFYGLLGSIINGINLLITQYLLPKLSFNIAFQAVPILFLVSTISILLFLFPFYIYSLLLSALSSFYFL